MASQAWVTTGTQWCDKMNGEASLMEKRVFPSEIMPDFPAYRVTARKCTLGMACNVAGYPCKWAYTDFGDDPFELSV